ncbi:MAG: RNA-guided endonuclease InsQ/TnpB family protein [Ktedonobacteraceae bacterium]
MKKAYKYRIYPTKKQKRLLTAQLALCAELYDAALQERRDAYRMCGKSITYTQQAAQMPAIKAMRPEYEAIYSQVLQDVLRRVDKAFKAFFRRARAGQQAGYPRFKTQSRYASLTYPQSGFGIDEQGKLSLSKLGHLKLVQHRPFKGVVKTCTISRSATGKWSCCFSCDEVEPNVLPPSHEQVGIDVGLETFAYLSTGERIDNPRFFREEEHQLVKAQRRLARAEKGTRHYRKRRKVVARVHERIGWRRENFVHQESCKLVKRFGLIAIEALVVRNLMKRPHPKQDERTGQYGLNGASRKSGLNKSIADAAWSAFFTALLAKVEETERTVLKVPPAYTTQTCSDCGYRQEMPLSVRVYSCEQCGIRRDRDHNASLTILQTALGRQGVALGA